MDGQPQPKDKPPEASPTPKETAPSNQQVDRMNSAGGKGHSPDQGTNAKAGQKDGQSDKSQPGSEKDKGKTDGGNAVDANKSFSAQDIDRMADKKDNSKEANVNQNNSE